MKNISIGKLRALQRCTSSRGTLTCLALDHRQNLRKINPLFEDDAQLSNFKMDVVKNIASSGTAVLLDPEISASQAISRGILPGDRGLVVSLEATGYAGTTDAREVTILSGWRVEKAKRMGADMVKLLVYYNPDSTTAAEIEEKTAQIGEDCIKYDLGLMLEPLSYSLSLEKLTSDEKQQVVIETARRLTQIPGVDVLKAEFPLDPGEQKLEKLRSACRELNNATSIPWIILSAAVGYDTYLQQVKICCEEGASGAAAGRAIWKEAILMKEEERVNFLQTTARERLSRLNALCFSLARPIQEWYCADAPFDWYKTY
jgi:tagatose 1,6-diphosphate aldolase